MSGNGDSDIRVIESKQADPSQVDALLDEAFGPAMRRFLIEHGDWMHGGPGGRFVATVDGVVAGYRGIIPTRCVLGADELSAVWGVNLYVRPPFRGMGLQRLLDQRLLEAAELRMSFPGELAAKIYAKQGYSIREDLWEWHMPLAPIPYWRARRSSARMVARQAPAAARAGIFQVRTRNYHPRRTEMTDSPDLAVLEDIFRRNVHPGLAATVRDTAFLRWRYVASPYRSELAFYLTSLHGRFTHYAIVRYGTSPSAPARILDVFGDFQDDEGLTDLMYAILRDGSHRQMSHAAVYVSSPELARAVRACRFFPINLHRFRWFAHDPKLHSDFQTAQLCWSLGDSDNDLQAEAFS